MKRIVLTSVCVLALSATFPPDTANALPLYKKVFDSLYVPRAPRQKTSCAVCHPSKTKRELNRYGRTLAEELRGKDTKNPAVIARAMKAIEHLFPGRSKSGD